MAMTIHCDIVSAEEEIFSGLVEMLVANGDMGELGVGYGHAPLLTSLVPGPIRVMTSGGEEEIFFASGGFIEVQGTGEERPMTRPELDEMLRLAEKGCMELFDAQKAALG